MPAYVIVTVAIHDPETFRKYTALTPALVKKHGGQFLTRGDEVSAIEGPAFTERLVILQFPNRAAVDAFFSDPDYLVAAKFRHASAASRIVVQEGRENTENPEPRV